MLSKIKTAIAALALTAQAAFAGQPEPVELAPIDHVNASLVVVASDGTDTTYSPADLERFATYRMTTTTPWRDEPADFEGVLLTDILRASGLDGAASISVTAENDYRTVIEREIWESVDILVATRVDGRAHTRRARGPIQFVIDTEAFEGSNLTSQSNLVWMAARIEVAG